MATQPILTHPYTGPAVLEWEETQPGMLRAIVSRPASYKRGSKFDVRKAFAFIRRSLDGNALLEGDGWVVSRGGFDDLTMHPTLAAAKLHVQALFALEQH